LVGCLRVDFDCLPLFYHSRAPTSFKEQTGLTPSEYLRNYRIENAKRLLAGSSLTAVEIAKRCGLGDPAHFCRLFQKMTGQTPIAYSRLKL